MLALDREELKFNDQDSFIRLFQMFELARSHHNFKFPRALFLEAWKHPNSQVQFLRHLLQSERTDLFSWGELEDKRLLQIEWNTSVKLDDKNQFWFCYDLVELLLTLATRASTLYVLIKELFNNPVQNYPELLLGILVQLGKGRFNGSGHSLLDELYSQLFPVFLQNQSNFSVIEFVWKKNPDLLYTVLSELYKKEQKIENTTLNLSRVLDIAQHLQNLQQMVSGNDYQFSVALGILAGKREFLHFDAWFQDRIKENKQPFIEQVLIYVQQHVIEQCNARNREIIQGRSSQSSSLSAVQNQYEQILEKAQLNIELLAIILESLAANREKLSQDQIVRFEQIFKSITEYFPTLMKGSSSDQNEATERAANELLEKIFKENQPIDEAIQLLKRYKSSEKKEEKEIFACIITGLLEEQCFHSKYPERELQITAQLIGAILEARLLEGKTFQIMLGIVSGYLNRSAGSPLLRFAVIALKRIEAHLTEPDYRKTCEEIFKNYQSIIEEDWALVGDLYQRLDASDSDLRLRLPEDVPKIV